MILELSDLYIPGELLHREKQLKIIKEIFTNFKKFKCGTNLVIMGVTGAGKTILIKKVIEGGNGSAVYIDGSSTTTPLKTIKKIFDINCKTNEEALRITIEKLKENPKIIIIDEIDKIKNINELFNNLNTIYRNTMLPIIIITLKRNLLTKMPIDAKKTLFFEKLLLSSYNAMELKNILDSRLSQIKIDIDFKEDARNFLAAVASRNGSARILLYIALRCIQKNNFSQEFIEEIYKEMMKDDWYQFTDDLNETESDFLKTLLHLCDHNKEITAEEIQEKLKYSQPRISQILNVFEKYSVIETYHKNFGRSGGRKRIIKFVSKEIYDGLTEKIWQK